MNGINKRFDRMFQIWQYTVGHGQLLIRSTRTEDLATPVDVLFKTRVDVLFKGVVALHMPTVFHGLLVTEVSEIESSSMNLQLGLLSIAGCKVFMVTGSSFQGYVVAAAVFFHEDDGHHNDPSYFAKSL